MDATENRQHSKIKGKVLAKIGGLTVFGRVIMPKHRGKKRILIQIRQGEGHDYRVAQCLSYGPSIDILFATDTARNSSRAFREGESLVCCPQSTEGCDRNQPRKSVLFRSLKRAEERP